MANVGSADVGNTPIGHGNGQGPKYASIGTGSGLTEHGVVVAKGAGAFVATATGDVGQVLTSNGPSSDPTFQAVSAVGAVTTITGDSGGPESPLVGNFNILGSGSITTVGSANTETVQLTGLTIYNVLLGAGTSTITKVAPSATSGIPLISQGAAAYPTFGTAVVAGGGTGSTSFNINGPVISSTTTTGALTAVTLTSGQLLIGGTTTPAAATLTAGTGVSISNGNNSITINATGGGITWNDVTGTSATMAVNNGYLADNAGLVTLALPATAVQFSVIAIAGRGAGGWTVTQAAGQQILFGSSNSTAGVTGSISSTNARDCVYMLATVGGASTVWTILNSVGNITIA